MAFVQRIQTPAYYNEFDPGAAAWLRELIRAGLIADGEVDTRSILDVSADDLRGFTQCHFFAGISGWSYALRLAGWPDDRPVWTGSPPCQPFSAAGRQEGRNDARHLAPHFVDLVRSCRPGVLFGEQVASSLVIGKSGNKGLHPLWRPVEPGLKPLAHGVSGRVGLLRGYGNAINPHAAAEFIRAFTQAADDLCRPEPDATDLPVAFADLL